MKNLMVLLVLIFLLTSCDEDKKLVGAVSDVTKESNISSSTAKKMIKYFKNCNAKCSTTQNIWIRNDTLKTILADLNKEYGVAGHSFLEARYRKGDEERYKKLNKINDSETSDADPEKQKAGDVDGYTTKILMVTTSDGDHMYFDVASICPPPAGCNGLSMKTTEITTSAIDTSIKSNDSTRKSQ